MGGVRAVVVGVEKYGAAWNLNGPARDAIRFVNWLLLNQVPPAAISLFVSALPENQPTVDACPVQARPATSHAIVDEFANVLNTRPDDLLIVFWGGHGVIRADKTSLLLTADATDANAANINLNSLLQSLRSDLFAGFKRQIVLVDACANYIEHLRRPVSLPSQTFAAGSPALPVKEQFVLLSAKAGEVAKNLDAEGAGLFSKELRAVLAAENAFPPDMSRVAGGLKRRFEHLRARGDASQTPTYFSWRDWDDTEVALGNPDAGAERPAAPASGGSRQDSAARARLAGALFACRAFQTGPDRVRILFSLPFFAEIRDDPDPRRYIDNAVAACEPQFRLEALVGALFSVERFSEQFQAACDALQQFRDWQVPWNLIFELKHLLYGVDIDEDRIAAVWRETLPFAPVPVPDSEEGLFSLCLYDLADRVNSPVGVFLTRLLPDFGAKRPAVEAWLQRAAIPAPRALPAPKTLGVAPVLVIKIEKDVNTADFHVAAWCRPRAGLLRGLEEPFPRARLNDALTICWKETRRLLEGDAEAQQRLVVEAFLPLELLADNTLEPEHIEVKHGLRSICRIGAEAPVVVRSLERSYNPESRQDTWGDWTAKWRRRPTPPRPFETDNLYWVRSDAELRSDHYATLRRDPLVFIALAEMPSGGAGIDIIAQMIDAGTPIALWRRRRGPDPDNCGSALGDLLCLHHDDELPRLVRNKRTGLPDDPLWHNLVLLWDDPDRLPPDLTN